LKARLTPREKKENAYDRDHVTLGYNSGTAFRKTWRKKETAEERSFRRAWHKAEADLVRATEPEELDPESSVRRCRIKKHRPPTVRELLEKKVTRRARSHGLKKERATVASARQDASVQGFLESVLRTKVVGALEQLHSIERYVLRRAADDRLSSEVVMDYLTRHPQWLRRLRTWRNAFLASRGALPKG
jgi:hypothetical protein